MGVAEDLRKLDERVMAVAKRFDDIPPALLDDSDHEEIRIYRQVLGTIMVMVIQLQEATAGQDQSSPTIDGCIIEANTTLSEIEQVLDRVETRKALSDVAGGKASLGTLIGNRRRGG